MGSYLEERLAALGLEVEVQPRQVATRDSGTAMVTTVHNVLGRRVGSGSTGTVVVVAHYDGAPLSLGAGDNGIGLAAILETVRALEAGESLRNDVVLVWLRGAGSAGVIETAMASVRGPAAYSVLDAVDADPAFDAELALFHRRGIPGLALLTLGGRAAHGQPLDRPINVSETTLQHAGAQLLDLTRALASGDLSTGASVDVAEQTYVSMPLGVLVHYPTAWAPVATGGLVLAFVLLFVLLRLRGGRWNGVLAGVALGVTVVGFGAALGSAMTRVLPSIHPEVGRLDTAVFEEGLLSVALVGLVVSVLTSGYFLARRRYPLRELTVGALAIPMVAVIALTFFASSSLVVVQVPLALALTASIGLTLIPTAGTNRWGRIGALIAGAGTLLFVVPGLTIVAESMTLAEARIIAAWMAGASLLLLPIIEWLGRPRAWVMPALGVVVAGAAVALSTPRFQDAARHPAPTSLALLVDDTLVVGFSPPGLEGTSVATEEASGESESASARWMSSRWLTVPGGGEGWARSWVVDPSGQGTAPGSLLLPATERWVVAGAGPETLLAAPDIEVFDRGEDGGAHLVDVEIRSLVEAEMVAVRLADASPGVLVVAGGHPVESTADLDPTRVAQFWGRPSDGVLRVTIRFDPRGAEESAPLAFDVIEHHLRPREILG